MILYETVFQNPELFRMQVSLSFEQSTLTHCRSRFQHYQLSCIAKDQISKFFVKTRYAML
jgi:hypothetical protein